MTKSNNKSGGLLSNTFSLAKKIGETGFELLNHATPKSVNKLSNQPDSHTVIEGSAEKAGYNKKKYDNPQQMIREHVPQVSRQLLGRHYTRVNNVASFISPSLNDKLSDYFFDKLNDFVSSASSVEHVLKEVGARDLQELRTDVARSERISQALANQNKVLAVVQGSLTGVSGVIGAAIDVPTSLALALRTVYQTGRAHGFELNKSEEQEVVQYIFKQVDFGSVAEKQALLVAVRTISNVLQTHNVQQLQQFLGSDSSTAPLKKWLSNEDGSLKWTWVDKLPQMSFLNKLTPFAGAGISAVYSWKLVEDANDKATIIFSEARRYLILHPDEQLTALVAYEKSEKLLAEASPILLADLSSGEKEPLPQSQHVSEPNEVIADVQVIAKKDVDEATTEPEKTLGDLATEYVEPVFKDEILDEKAPVDDTEKEKEDLNGVGKLEQDVVVKADEKEVLEIEKNQVIEDVKVISKQDEAQHSVEAEKTLDMLAEQYVAPAAEQATISTDQQALTSTQQKTDVVEKTEQTISSVETNDALTAETNDKPMATAGKKQLELKRSKKSS